MPERYVDVGVLFSFHFTASGDMMLTVDGHDKGVFLTGIDSRTPLWVMVDIYGNTTAVQFVGKSIFKLFYDDIETKFFYYSFQIREEV